MNHREVLRRPLVTEKSMAGAGEGRYSFEVAIAANKVQIKQAVQAIWPVQVERVNTLIVHGKPRRLGRSSGRRPDWKKAIVTLKSGQRLDLFEGLL